jgi:hypothetical protein
MLYGSRVYELHSIQILHGIDLELAVSCLFTLYNKTYFFQQTQHNFLLVCLSKIIYFTFFQVLILNY